MTTRRRVSIIEKIEADLAYRLPTSGKPLSCIVLGREQAEQLLQEIYDLRVEATGKAKKQEAKSP